MDVRTRKLFFCFFVLTTMACAKSSSDVWEGQNKAQTCENARIMNKFIVKWDDGRVTFHKDTDAESFDENFVKPNLTKIERVEYDRVIQINTKTEAQSYSNPAADWGQTMADAPAVWAQGIRGQGILVAVTDTGIDYNHPQLQNRLAPNMVEINGVPGEDDDGNGVVDDFYGWNFHDNSRHAMLVSGEDHGTHVAGIIAADHNSGSVKGMAPESLIVPAKFLYGEGYGSTSGAIASLNYSASRGARIINASWGGECSRSLQETFVKLSAQGILLIAAAGNDGHDLDSFPDYPAVLNVPHQITVSALRSDGAMAGFSNHSYVYSHIAAPGDPIISLKPGNAVRSMFGTSMAAPFVAGAAALLWSAKPNATAGQVRQALLSSVDSGPYRVSSQGRLNVRKALDTLRTLVP